MDSLYQTRVKKGETDLIIEQLREVLHFLNNFYKVSNSQGCLSRNDKHCYHFQGKQSAAQYSHTVFAHPPSCQACCCRPTCTRLRRS